MNKLSKQVSEIDGSAVTWVSNSTSIDEDGTPTLLLSAVTDASVEDVIKSASSLLPSNCVCELWGSAPAMLPLRPLEGYDQHLLCNDATFSEEWASVTMKKWGMFLQKELLASDEVVELKQHGLWEIDNAEYLLKVHRSSIKIDQDLISFREISSRGNERFDLLLAPSSKAYTFVSDIIFERVSNVLEHIIGEIGVEVDCDVSVVYSKPGALNQGWHADGDHQKGSKDAGWDVDGWKTSLSEPYAICLFVPLIDLDDDTGFTQFWPASHRNNLAGFGPFAEISGAVWDGKINAGHAIWYDYRLMHRGIKNDSALLRPVLQLLFKRKWYTERRNYGNESIVP